MYKDSLLSSCSALESLRVIRISFDLQYIDLRSSKSLPDVHDLYDVEIPPSLEYLLWEVPGMKRFYSVTRERGTVSLVYNGYDGLPSRPYYPKLSWTNETVLGYVGVGEDDK